MTTAAPFRRVVRSAPGKPATLPPSLPPLPADKQRALARLVLDFPVFAMECLRILPKAGGAPVPFVLNEAQRFLHGKIEEQLASTGKVRVIVLKGRQQGISTYTEGRYYWRVSHQRGKRAFILTHEDKATQNLFGMVDRYWQHAPVWWRPKLGASNAKELVFSAMESRYDVATAGAKDTGRGGTAQFFHGSEVAFWPHAQQHLAGIGQVVPDMPGTEIVFESTANGTANVFHELWQMAVKGRSDFLPVFVPWFWQAEYQTPPPEGWELTDEERDYAEAFGISVPHMVWRRRKVDTDFRGDAGQFDQEYPASAELAFASSSPRALIKHALVAKARRARDVEALGPRIMGLDPAEYGDDWTSVTLRQGRVARRLDRWNGAGTMETVGRVALIADRHKPDLICCDATGVGTGVADRLKELGYPVIRVHFGESARDKARFGICRDEMWGLMADWLEDGPVSIEDDDDLAAQLTSVQYSYDSSRRLKLESKEKMKDRGLASPDDADSLALTFYPGVPAHTDTARAFRRLRGYAR